MTSEERGGYCIHIFLFSIFRKRF